MLNKWPSSITLLHSLCSLSYALVVVSMNDWKHIFNYMWRPTSSQGLKIIHVIPYVNNEIWYLIPLFNINICFWYHLLNKCCIWKQSSLLYIYDFNCICLIGTFVADVCVCPQHITLTLACAVWLLLNASFWCFTSHSCCSPWILTLMNRPKSLINLFNLLNIGSNNQTVVVLRSL